MKHNYFRILLIICLSVLSVTLLAQTTAKTEQYPDYLAASDYTDCNNAPRFSLPLDIDVTEDYWLKGYVEDLTQGVSAYLYSDTDFKFEVYISCFLMTPVYSTTFKMNKTSTINHTVIQDKLEQYGISDYSNPIYIRISPVDGNGGRLVMRADSERMYSDCSNPLLLAPGLNLRSYRTSDVYALDPRDFSHEDDLFVRWYTKDSVSCQAKMTLGACDGEVLEEKTLLLTKEVFRLTPELLTQTAQNNQLLYFHFEHDVDSTCYVQCLASKYTEKVYTKTACQGKGVTIGDTTFYESTYYFRDTAYMSGNTFYIRYYDIIITEPEPVYDTIALRPTQFPYTYRGQEVPDYGDYDFTIHINKKCDERYLLHVGHVIDTIVQLTDTTLCYGAIFEYEGEMYDHDVSFGKSYWKNQDTLIFDTLNVYFATTPEIVYDTIMQHDFKYGKTFKQTGDFAFTYTNPTTYCVDSINLHVLPGVDDGVKYDYYYIDTTLCQGMEYEDYYGNIYTTSTVLYDTIWRIPNKHCEIEITTITFTEPDIQFDTISLKTTQLPYNYNTHCRVDSFGVYDYTVHVRGRCDEHYQLLVLHDIDTLVYATDTLLCYGKVFVQDIVEYQVDTTLQTVSWLNADTLQIDVLNLYFATLPDEIYETLLLEPSELPYQYRDTIIITFGEYELLLYNEEGCQELVYLSVVEKKTTTDVDNTSIYDRPRLILRDGVVYILRGTETFTLLGERI